MKASYFSYCSHHGERQSEQVDFVDVVKLAAVSSLLAGVRTYGSLLQLGREAQ